MEPTGRLDVIYCAGWDAVSRQLVGVTSPADARERDEQGEQYAVALVPPEGEVPQALIEISWRDRFARTWIFGDDGRRHTKIEYRQPDAHHLFVIQMESWQYTSPQQPEFDEAHAGHTVLEIMRDGMVSKEHSPNGYGGGMTATRSQRNPEEFTISKPSFGDWVPLAGLVAETELNERPSITAAPRLSPEQLPWQPSRPLQPESIDDLFTPGRRFTLSAVDGSATVEVRPAGVLRLTSGRLIAVDPAWLEFPPQPFAVDVEPGAYPVELAVLHYPDHPEHELIAAAKLRILDEAATSWEQALREGDDALVLGDGQFYGIGVDAGQACFIDADAVQSLQPIVEKFFDSPKAANSDSQELQDPETGANLIMFSSGYGDGAYPAWLGRTADGRVACFVADMLVVDGPAMTGIDTKQPR